MILTVTLNLAQDVTYRVPRLEPGHAHTLQLIAAQAGGKGVNVSRILKQLGVRALATGFVGGVTGEMVVNELTEAGLDHRLVSVPGETRRCMAVISEENASVTEMNERGPEVPRRGWNEFVKTFDELLESEDVRVTVLSGSLPPGVPVDAYATLINLSHDADVPVILDSSGDALREGLKGRPEIVKPNREELLEALGKDATENAKRDASNQEFDPAEWIPLAQALRAKGVGAVVASFGADGLLAMTAEDAWLARPPRVSGNPVGAGDAVTAALAKACLEGTDWPRTAKDAAALSAAAAASVRAGRFDESIYSTAMAETELMMTP